MMSFKLPEGGIYVEEEDLTDAPPGVLQFLLKLKDKQGSKTGRQNRQRIETEFRTQQVELGELTRSLTEIVQRSTGQDASRSTAYAETLSSPAVIDKIDAFITAVNVLETRQNRDLGTSLPIGQLSQKPGKNTLWADNIGKLRAEVRAEVRAEMRAEMRAELSKLQPNSEESVSGEAPILTFDRDVVMVVAPDEPAEHGRIPSRAQDDEPAVENSRAWAPLGTSSAPLNVDLLPVEDLGPTSCSLPEPSGTDSDVLEELVRFGIKHWPRKNLGCFRPGQLITGHILNELLRADLPAQYALGVPPSRVNKLKEACAGIVFPYHVDNSSQISEDEKNRNHFVIAIVNKQDKTFTSWGMSEAMIKKSKSVYEKALQFNLESVGYKLSDYTGNCCAFRCVEAVRSYFRIDTTIRNGVSLRLFFLKRLLKSWIATNTQAVEVQAPGGSVTAVAGSSCVLSRDQSGQTLVTETSTTGLLLPDSDDSADRPKMARNILPSIPIQQAKGRRNSQAPSTKVEETMLVIKGPGTAGRTSHKRSSWERPINAPASTLSREKDETGTESAEPPPKRKDKDAPSPEILAEELTGSGATERIRHHVLACKRDAPAFPKAWDDQRDWVEQTCEFLNLAHEWDEKSEFSKLVALILRTHGVERLYIEARRKFHINERAEDPPLPTSFIDQVSPFLLEKRSIAAFRTWLKGTKNLLRLSEYLPFIPFSSKGSIAFRQYERLPNKAIQQLRSLLDNNSRAQRLAKIGRAFQDCILQRQAFLWKDISYEDLSKLPDDLFLHLLTIRRDAGPSLTIPNSMGKQCDLCEGEMCELFTLHDLASRQPTSPAHEDDDWERVSSLDTTAYYNNTTTGMYQTCTSKNASPPASTALPNAGYNPSAMSLPSAQVSTCNGALWQEEYKQFSNTGPQLQLALPVIVSDTAQSITFAMNGNIDGLKRLFSLGLASPYDRSYSRGFSLLRWALYGGHSGMHHYEIVQFLFDQGAHVDNESYETVGYYNLSNKYSNTDRQALRCLARQDRNWFKEQNFPLIHKIIFGMSRKSLADELLQNPDAVFATDAQGRTALDWATVRAQLDDMKLLIAHGSSPNSMDIFGRTTILHAVDSRSSEALRIVLRAGADPEPQIPKNLFRGNPLTSANLNGLPGMVKLLIEFGAKIDAANPEGLTALHSAAVSQNPECASILLAHNADMDHMSSNGCTPLVTAIMHNSHAVLGLFLGKHVGSLNGSQLLPIIAEHADSETMSILTSSQLFDLSSDCLPADRAILSCRKDYSDALGHAFDSLVSACQCHTLSTGRAT